MRIFITGMGIISPAGLSPAEVLDTLSLSRTKTSPLSLFPVKSDPAMPCGQISTFSPETTHPRSHALALAAARQALIETRAKPDALIVGTTTGGMLTSEEHLSSTNHDPAAYTWHAPGSVGEYVAQALKIEGPVLTISTACASGASILKLALQMIRSQSVNRVLAIGVDSLCRLTYYGFSLLQLLSPEPPKPFDRHRRGLNVAEAAAALMLEAETHLSSTALAELAGGGLSCDAYHVTAPHKDGQGASLAMTKALIDASVSPREIDYINCHGTGTVDNDAAEAKAIHTVFGSSPPQLSSTKGIYGHPLAAAGTVEAVICVLAILNNLVPANTGFEEPDPELGLAPVLTPGKKQIDRVLSNSFGFGGNNAAIILTRPGEEDDRQPDKMIARGFLVLASACLTGAGAKKETLRALSHFQNCQGIVPDGVINKGLDSRATRRLKRLPKLTLALAVEADKEAAAGPLGAISFGTGLGALSETHAFLDRLFKTNEKFSSPTDFIGSLHNSPAGLAAIHLGCQGPNITATGSDDSFEEALYCAVLAASDSDGPILCLAADEAHALMSPLLDRSTQKDQTLSDGGGAFILKPTMTLSQAELVPAFLSLSAGGGQGIEAMIQALGGPERINARFGALFVSLPAASETMGKEQLKDVVSRTRFSGPIIDYRQALGQYGTVSATACVLAHHFVKEGQLPPMFSESRPISLNGKGILMIGLGPKLSAVTIGKWADL